MSCASALEGFMSMNNGPNDTERVNGKNRLVSVIIALLIFSIINLVVGPYLWNEVMRKLVPVCGKARWYDTVALSVLIGLLAPQ